MSDHFEYKDIKAVIDSRKAVIKALSDDDPNDSEMVTYYEGYEDGLDNALELIQNVVKTADTITVHARWTELLHGIWGKECTNCKRSVYFSSKGAMRSASYDYCPHCGAKMDGGK